jgi:hypothetical protein
MVPKLFEILFLLALIAPALTVLVGVALLFVPTGIKRAETARGRRVTPA